MPRSTKNKETPAGRAPALVVGTTPDYVVKLQGRFPDNTSFILDSRFFGSPELTSQDETKLLFASLEEPSGVWRSLKNRLTEGTFPPPAGIACFDCDSLILACRLARELDLPFPEMTGILRARNKFEAREKWMKTGVPSPRARLLSDLKEALSAFRRFQSEVVLKPLSGSGSELVFRCNSEREVAESVKILTRELPKRIADPLFRPLPSLSGTVPVDPRRKWVMEEFVPGPEFSCDFLLKEGRVTIIRETGKIMAEDQSFGSVLAYLCPAAYPEGFSPRRLSATLKKAVEVLGFTRGHFMADFILRDSQPVIIEISPRPGGDAIPDLMETATGLDILGLHLEFATGKNPAPGPPQQVAGAFASINFFASKSGIVSRLDLTRLSAHPRVRAVFLRKKVGDEILLPPDSYDHRHIGHCIVELESGEDPAALAACLDKSLDLFIDDTACAGHSPNYSKCQ